MYARWSLYIYIARLVAACGVLISFIKLPDNSARRQLSMGLYLLIPLLLVEVIFKISLSLVTVFIDRFVDHQVAGFHFPTGLIVSTEPFFAFTNCACFFLVLE